MKTAIPASSANVATFSSCSDAPVSVDLSWTIQAPAGRVVSLNFTMFNTSDFVSLHNGKSKHSPQLAKLSGSRGLRKSFSSTGSFLTVFRSSGRSGPGFTATFKAILPPSPPPLPVYGWNSAKRIYTCGPTETTVLLWNKGLTSFSASTNLKNCGHITTLSLYGNRLTQQIH